MEVAYRGFVIRVDPQLIGLERWTTHFCLIQSEVASVWETECIQNETAATEEHALTVALHTARRYIDIGSAKWTLRRHCQP